MKAAPLQQEGDFRPAGQSPRKGLAHFIRTLVGGGGGRGTAAARSSLVSLLARPVNLAVSLVATSLVIRSLGEEQFGVWAVCLNIGTILISLALGVPHSILNHLATARAASDRTKQAIVLSSAFFLVAGFAIVVLVAGWGWVTLDQTVGGLVRSAPGVPRATIANCGLVFIMYAALGAVGLLYERVAIAQQDGWLATLCQVFGNVLGLGLICLVAFADGGLVATALAWVAGAIGGFLLNAVLDAWLYGSWVVPRLALADRVESLSLLVDGWKLMALVCIGLLTLQSDPLIIAAWKSSTGQADGALAAAQVAIPLRFFNVMNALVTVALSPLWPAYADARARGDAQWARKTLFRTTVATLAVASIVAAPSMLLGRRVIELWIGEPYAGSDGLLYAMGFWAWAVISCYPIVLFLNGMGYLRVQLSLAAVFLLCVMPAKVLGLEVWGPAGMVGMTVAVFVVLQMIPLFAFVWWLSRGGRLESA